MKKCDVCNRETNRTYRLGGYTLCSKHMHQYHKYGRFLDNIQRTNNDLNDYVVDESSGVAVFNVYNQKNVKVSEFIIDLEDLPKVKYKKWRMSFNHVVTGLPSKGTQRDLAHVVLGVKPNGLSDFVVDHINCDPLDNRKCNLRVCSQSENVLNKSFMSTNTSGFLGISFDDCRGKWASEIRFAKKRVHFKRSDTLEEAVYMRYVAEKLLFGEFANKGELQKKEDFFKGKLSEDVIMSLKTYVTEKLKEKGLWQ